MARAVGKVQVGRRRPDIKLEATVDGRVCSMSEPGL